MNKLSLEKSLSNMNLWNRSATRTFSKLLWWVQCLLHQNLYSNLVSEDKEALAHKHYARHPLSLPICPFHSKLECTLRGGIHFCPASLAKMECLESFNHTFLRFIINSSLTNKILSPYVQSQGLGVRHIISFSFSFFNFWLSIQTRYEGNLKNK